MQAESHLLVPRPEHSSEFVRDVDSPGCGAGALRCLIFPLMVRGLLAGVRSLTCNQKIR